MLASDGLTENAGKEEKDEGITLTLGSN